ncbi:MULTISPECIES: glycosyltransferase family 2 protein [unclassified Nocardioides]|uniref:glycosyltransferase family 2 protein n=1 Tax=unclassified Nocardioides TaxID=2615069 RepID=UPI0013FD4396|nr:MULTISPECIES: glycosyltransferase [unclassified Nocardioides]
MDDKLDAIAIAICTYRRPEQLARTLKCMASQMQTVANRVELIVVDNDPHKSAYAVAREAAAIYLPEEATGIAHARNRALTYVTESTTRFASLIFFDDDQTPRSGWLRAFVRAMDIDPTCVWTGPVRPTLDFDVPEWAAEGWPWSRPEYSDTQVVNTVGNGNVLIPLSLLRESQVAYATEFTSMGEDTDFFWNLRSSGYQVRYAASAIADEDVPPTRRTLEWASERAYNSALAWTMIVHRRERRPRVRIAMAICKKIAALAGAIFVGRGTSVRRARRLCDRKALRGLLEGFTGTNDGRRR